MAEKSKKKYTHGEKFQQRTQRVFELLLDCAFQEIALELKETCTEKSTKDTPQYRFEVTKKGLIAVASRKRWKNGKGWEFNDEKDQRWTNEIYPALSHYLGNEFLGILQRGSQQGRSKWSFTLRLWHWDKAKNLEMFADKWQEACQARSKVAIPQAQKADQGIEWRSACKAQLERQKQQITSSPLHRKVRDLDSVHVPLALVERKERPKIDRTPEISPERGSAAEQPEYTEKRVEHEAFLAEIGKRQPGEHLVILGEPGAGKTTLLTKVWEWLLDHEQPGEDLIVAWVPLAAVKNNELEEYLHKSWIKQFCKTSEIDRYWASFEALADAGRVWLLLDGADEMGGDALGKIEGTLREAWARSTRAIITCRLNLWDASSTNQLQTSPNFQVYRTLDFKYVNPAGQDEVKSFIDNWFQTKKEPEVGQKLRAALNEAGKERIKDLAQNPLRLTLLCAIWDDDRALPETQAGLYELFVDYVYDWKAKEFSGAVKLRRELDRALGNLAKQGINKPSLRFCFTEVELRKWVPLVEQCQALMDLGWLNCVGEENQHPVFAFFHPTFQEYFAACSIDDWDYFLPRAHVDHPVPCFGENRPTYRVFAKQWEQTILLWFGRRDLENDLKETDKEKEEFLDKLTDFQADCGDSPYHYFLAYRIAVIGVSEFNSSRKAQLIVDQIVEFAFGRFNSETKQWHDYVEWLRDLAKAAIYLTNQSCAIRSLQSLLLHPNSGGNPCSNKVGDALDRITGKSRQDNIENLYSPQQYMDDYKLTIFHNTKIPDQGQILKAIATIEKPIINCDPAKDPYRVGSGHYKAILTLRKAKADERATKALVTFLSHDCQGLCLLAAEALGKIAKGDEQAIRDLIALLKDSDVKYYVCFNVFVALNEIVTQSKMPLAIRNLKEHITKESKELNFRRFEYCQIIIFQYVQVLSYAEFYDIWHQFPPNDAS
jgi:energy-coupling factor transporter ATP-binding protein EcfA2